MHTIIKPLFYSDGSQTSQQVKVNQRAFFSMTNLPSVSYRESLHQKCQSFDPQTLSRTQIADIKALGQQHPCMQNKRIRKAIDMREKQLKLASGELIIRRCRNLSRELVSLGFSLAVCSLKDTIEHEQSKSLSSGVVYAGLGGIIGSLAFGIVQDLVIQRKLNQLNG